MVGRGLWMMGVVCALALMAPIGAAAAEGDQLRATIEKPATVTVPARTSAASDKSVPLVVHVTGSRTAADSGGVQAVVKAQLRDGTEQEIGRFSPFGEGPQSFRVSLPKELAGGGPVKLKVHLVPTTGKGEGAQLEIGRVGYE